MYFKKKWTQFYNGVDPLFYHQYELKTKIMLMVRQLFAAFMNPRYQRTALRVALVVGSVLFIINHAQALITRKMNRARWISGLLTYCVPYMVSLHGQQQGGSRNDNSR